MFYFVGGEERMREGEGEGEGNVKREGVEPVMVRCIGLAKNRLFGHETETIMKLEKLYIMKKKKKNPSDK